MPLVNKYRDMSNIPEMNVAIDEIVNEVVGCNDEDQPVSIKLDKLESFGCY